MFAAHAVLRDDWEPTPLSLRGAAGSTALARWAALRKKFPVGSGGRKHDGNPDIAADARRIERYRVFVAPHPQIDARGTEPQIAQDHLVQKRRQARIAQPDLALERIELQAERGFQQRERRGAGPGLRRAGDRIERRPLAM